MTTFCKRPSDNFAITYNAVMVIKRKTIVDTIKQTIMSQIILRFELKISMNTNSGNFHY